MTVLQGDAGDGKSTFILKLAAMLTMGEPMPFTDGNGAEPVNVIYQSTEDDADDTIGFSQACIITNGYDEVQGYGHEGDTVLGIRPACNINLSYVNGLDGSGTKEDPYELDIDPSVVARPIYTQGSVYQEHPRSLSVSVLINRNAPNDEDQKYVLAAGVKLTVNGENYYTDANGQATIPYPGAGVVVSKDGYVSRKLYGSQLSESPKIYLQKTADCPVISAVWADDKDVLHEEYQMDLINSGRQAVSVEVDWGNGGEGTLALRQNSAVVQLSSGRTRVTWSDHFDVSQTVNIVATAANGTKTTLPLKLAVDSPALSELEGYSFAFSDKMSFTLGDNAGIFSGSTLSLGLDSKVPFTCTVKDGKFYVAIGVAKRFSQKPGEGVTENTDDLVTQIKDLISKSKKSGNDVYKEFLDFRADNENNIELLKGSWNFDADFCVLGFLEGYINSNDEVVFIDGGMITSIESSAKWGVPFFLGEVPMFVEAKVAASIEARMNLYVNSQARQFTPSSTVSWTTSLKLGIGVGVQRIVSVSGGGKGTLSSTWDINLGRTDSYRLEGTIEPYVDVNVLIFDASLDFSILDPIYDETLYEYPETNSASVLAYTADIYDSERYTVAEVSRLSSVADWIAEQSATANDDETVLLSNTYANADPQLLTLPNGDMMLLFLAMSPDSNDANGVRLYYSVCSDGVWSTPAPYHNDGTADVAPRSAMVNGQPYVIWQNFTDTVNADTTLADAASKTQISGSGFGGGISAISAGGALSMQPVICSDGDKLSAVWIGNEANNWFGTQGNSILCSEYNGGSWSEPRVLYSGLGNIASVAADFQNGDLRVAWVEDTDGDLYTKDDLEIFENGVALTNNDVVDSGVTYAGHTLYWYSDGALVANGETVLVPESFVLSDRFQIVDEGENRVLLFTLPDEFGSKLCAAWYLNGRWSQPVALTDGSALIGDFAASVAEDGALQLVYSSTAYTENETDPYGGTSLVCKTVYPYGDLVLENVDYDGSTYVAGKDLSFKLDAVNNGTMAISSITAEIFDEDGSLLATELFDVDLLPGEGVRLVCAMPVTKVTQNRQIAVKLSTEDMADIARQNNEMDTTLFWDDLSLEQVFASLREDDQAVVYGSVVNRGYTAHSAVEVSLRKNAPDGEVVATKTIDRLDTLDLAGVSFVVESEEDTAWYLTIDCEDSKSSNNNAFAVFLVQDTVDWGNVDMQGTVTASDALMTLQAATAKINLTEYQERIADVNQNGQVDAADALAILQYATRKIQKLPV